MRSWCAVGIDGALLAEAEVLVSELVTRALVHGGGRIILRACLDQDQLLVEVIDQHPQFKRELWRIPTRDDHAAHKTLAPILVNALKNDEDPVACDSRDVGEPRLRAKTQNPSA